MEENNEKQSKDSEPNKPLQNTGREWLDFLSVFLAPSVVIYVGITILLTYLLFNISSSANAATTNVSSWIQAVTSAMIAIFSGLAGAEISQKWSKIKETSVLITRGKSAIRGLNLLNVSIASLERRVSKYVISYNKLVQEQNGDDSNFILLTYDEIIERCNLLQEEAINAIEEWQDIIPEVANLKTEIGEFTKLKAQKSTLEIEISKLKNDLEEAKGKSEDEIDKLKKKLANKNKELEKVSFNLNSTSPAVASIFSQAPMYRAIDTSSVSVSAESNLTITTCSNCGTMNVFSSDDRVRKCGKCGYFDGTAYVSATLK